MIPALAMSLESHMALLKSCVTLLPLAPSHGRVPIPQQGPSPALQGDWADHTSLLYTCSSLQQQHPRAVCHHLLAAGSSSIILSSQLSTCCSWPASLLSLCFFPPPSRLTVVSENYPYFSLLRDYRPLNMLPATCSPRW